jgi:hypothetical protein
VDLWEENEEAWELWEAAYTQWRSSGFGRTGLDFPAVGLIAGWLEIEMTGPLFRKIKALERFELSRQAGGEDEEACDAQDDGEGDPPAPEGYGGGDQEAEKGP